VPSPTAPIPVTLSDYEGHSPVASPFKLDFHTGVQQLTTFQLWSMFNAHELRLASVEYVCIHCIV